MTEPEIQQSVNAAAAHHSAGRFGQAETLYRQVLASRPAHLDALHLLGTLCAQTGRRGEGIDLLTRACEINPSFAPIHNNLGTALRSSGQIDRAMAAYRRTIELDPRCAPAHNDMGIALRMKGRPNEAIAAHLKALELNPRLADPWTNIGLARADKGDFARALADSRKAIELDPAHARAHLNFAMLMLQLGDFEHGWPEYEWRWKCRDLLASRSFTQPLWDGKELQGKTILLHAEQGFGDTLQFVRYAPMVARRGGRVILECQKALHRLLQDIPGIDRVIAAGQELPPFDLHCPLMSLPLKFATSVSSIPAMPRYVEYDKRLADECRRKMTPADGTLKVGLAWAGKPNHENDHNRSMPLAQMAALAMPGVTFFSLQKGPAATQAANPPAGMRLIDFTEEWADFSDTAALVANLDLVISVDTSAVHLAGAMGKPVWTLLPFNPDWRWLLNRDDSPWYPTMRLFRQRKPGGWDEVIARVREALTQSANRN